MTDKDELARLRQQVRGDRKLIERAAQALAELDRADGLSDEHADILASLRLRLEGKKRASLEDLLTATSDISGRRDLGDAVESSESSSDWPEVTEKKRDWPGL